MKNILNKIKVAPIQFSLMGLNATFGTCISFDALENYANGEIMLGTIEAGLSLVTLKTFFIQKNYYKKKIEEYKKVKSALEKYGWDRRIVKTKRNSWCQRHLAQIASDETGYGEQTKNYFYEKGYRWYHFLPD